MRDIRVMRRTTGRRQGFTIVELLIVVVVIAILAAIVIVSYNGIQQRAKIAVLQTDITNAVTLLEVDNVSNGTYPASESQANSGAGLKPSAGTTYQYSYTSSNNSYCVTGVNSGFTYFASSSNKSPQQGECSGHSCPTGFVTVPGNSSYGTSDFCVAKYEMKQASGTVPVSRASGTPWDNISYADAVTYSANVADCIGCHLMTEAERLTIAQNVLNVASNWSGGSVGSGYIFSGHSDSVPNNAAPADGSDSNSYVGTNNSSGETAATYGLQGNSQRRTLTLSNGSVIWDLSGNVWEWTQGSIPGNQQTGLSSDSAYGAKEWNNPALILGAVAANNRPSFGTPAASGWTSAQGIGLVYSNRNETNASARYLQRGGSYGSGTYAGIYYIGISTNIAQISVGFRVVK